MLSIDFVKIPNSINRQVNISESGSISRFIDSAILGVWPIALRLFIGHVIMYVIMLILLSIEHWNTLQTYLELNSWRCTSCGNSMLNICHLHVAVPGVCRLLQDQDFGGSDPGNAARPQHQRFALTCITRQDLLNNDPTPIYHSLCVCFTS